MKADTSQCTPIVKFIELEKADFDPQLKIMKVEFSQEIDKAQVENSIIVYRSDDKTRKSVKIENIQIKGEKIDIKIENEIENKAQYSIGFINTLSIKSDKEEDMFFIDFPIDVDIVPLPRSLAMNLIKITVTASLILASINPRQLLMVLITIQELEYLTFLEIETTPFIVDFYEYIHEINLFNYMDSLTPNSISGNPSCDMPTNMKKYLTCGVFYNTLYLFIILMMVPVTFIVLKIFKFQEKLLFYFLDRIIDCIQIRAIIGVSFYIINQSSSLRNSHSPTNDGQESSPVSSPKGTVFGSLYLEVVIFTSVVIFYLARIIY